MDEREVMRLTVWEMRNSELSRGPKACRASAP